MQKLRWRLGQQGFGTAEVGIALALVAILMIGFLVIGSNMKFVIDEKTTSPDTQPPVEEMITLRTPN